MRARRRPPWVCPWWTLLWCRTATHVQALPRTPQQATEDVESLQAWLEAHPAGASHALTLPDEAGFRLTHWAASGGHIEVLQSLVQRKADPWDGTATAEERSPLLAACQSGHVDVVNYLLSKDVLKRRSRGALNLQQAVDMKDKGGTPCLHLAATAGHAEVLEILQRKGADLTITTQRSGTALHAAAAVGQEEAVETLLRLGADPCVENDKGQTPAARAKAEEMDEILDILAPYERKKGCGRDTGGKGHGQKRRRGKAESEAPRGKAPAVAEGKGKGHGAEL
mmetsp:Transcript_62487/g.116123  ORF Transcript_62487/g.116123 Transcript_62487/m.116123 type:complete len:282 (+) Transcript_62487:89-934(+)